MGTEKSLSRYILVVLSVSVVLTALIIVALNAYVTNKRLADGSGNGFLDTAMSGLSYEEGYKAGYNAAREKFSITPKQITSIVGQVSEIGTNEVIVKAQNLDTDEMVDGISDLRTVVISTSTELLVKRNLTDQEMANEMAKWNASSKQEAPPLPFVLEKAELADLSSTSTVTVTAEEDIRYAETFTASRFIINQ